MYPNLGKRRSSRKQPVVDQPNNKSRKDALLEHHHHHHHMSDPALMNSTGVAPTLGTQPTILEVVDPSELAAEVNDNDLKISCCCLEFVFEGTGIPSRPSPLGSASASSSLQKPLLHHHERPSTTKTQGGRKRHGSSHASMVQLGCCVRGLVGCFAVILAVCSLLLVWFRLYRDPPMVAVESMNLDMHGDLENGQHRMDDHHHTHMDDHHHTHMGDHHHTHMDDHHHTHMEEDHDHHQLNNEPDTDRSDDGDAAYLANLPRTHTLRHHDPPLSRSSDGANSPAQSANDDHDSPSVRFVEDLTSQTNGGQSGDDFANGQLGSGVSSANQQRLRDHSHQQPRQQQPAQFDSPARVSGQSDFRTLFKRSEEVYGSIRKHVASVTDWAATHVPNDARQDVSVATLVPFDHDLTTAYAFFPRSTMYILFSKFPAGNPSTVGECFSSSATFEDSMASEPSFGTKHGASFRHGGSFASKLGAPGKATAAEFKSLDKCAQLREVVNDALRDLAISHYVTQKTLAKSSRVHLGVLPVLLASVYALGGEVEAVEQLQVPNLQPGVQVSAIVGGVSRTVMYLETHAASPKTQWAPMSLAAASSSSPKQTHTDLLSQQDHYVALCQYMREYGPFQTVMHATGYAFLLDTLREDDSQQLNRLQAFILVQSNVIIQDDSGVPYEYLFGGERFDVEVFGKYLAPGDPKALRLAKAVDFHVLYQPELRAAFRSKGASVKQIPFDFGYKYLCSHCCSDDHCYRSSVHYTPTTSGETSIKTQKSGVVPFVGKNLLIAVKQ